MNITVNSTLLAQELRLLNHVAPAKPAIPILANILIRADDSLTFYASDFEIGFRTTCPAVIAEPGSVTLPAKRLLDLVEQLPDANVQIVTDQTHVRVLSGAFKSRLQTMSPDDFPKVLSLEGKTSTLPTTAFQTMINRTRFAISDKTKYMVAGALLTLTDTVAALVATDGKRLSLVTMPRVSGAFTTAIIPTKTLDAILALFSSDDIVFSHTDRHLFFASGDRLLVSRTIDGEFPKYERIIPRDTDKHANINRAALSAALRRVGILSEETRAAYFSFEPGALLITSSSAQAGDAFERVPMTYDGPVLKVCVNWQYVLDFLSAATGNSVTLDFKSVSTPLLLTDGTDFINVLMLMRGQ